MGAFQDIIAGALSAVRESAGVSILYRRGARQLPITAGVGTNAHELEDGDGGIVSEFTIRPYLIGVDDLASIGDPPEPLEGDEIDETIKGTKHTFQVVSQDNEPAFRFTDRGRTQFRVNTQEIG